MPTDNTTNLTVLIQLEAMARRAEDLKALQFLMVNETRRLLSYRQAFAFSTHRGGRGRHRFVAASSIAVVDPDAPFVRWLERAVNSLEAIDGEPAVRRIDASSCPGDIGADWAQHSLPFVLWCPLCWPDGTTVGGLWFARETPWQDHELTLTARLAETYAHAWSALLGQAGWRHAGRSTLSGRRRAWLVLAAFVAAAFIPVRLSTLAPAEIVAAQPSVVSAPMDGVIASVEVPPNTAVSKGDILLKYEDTSLRNQYEVAQKTLAVSEAEYRKATQGAFLDPRSKAQVALLQAQVALSRAERDYAQELLDRVLTRAAVSGLLIYSNESDWVGRPVRVGERIMEIADPGHVKLRIDLPVDDAIVLRNGAQVDVFLDVDPLRSLSATVTQASYQAQVTPRDVLAYRVEAALEPEVTGTRIGLQGTAKIYGERVTLFFFVFRRPISAVRQRLGL